MYFLGKNGVGIVIKKIDCSQSPIFSRGRLDIPHLTVKDILIFKCTEGADVRDYTSGGGGATKIEGL